MLTTSYLAHFGLSQAPFGKDIPDADLWLPPSKQDLVDQLQDAVTARESLLLYGEPGVGKTCVLRALRHRLGSHSFRLTYCHNAPVGRRDFYRQLCLAMALAPAATAGALFHSLASHIQDLRGDRCHPVLLLDEAHLLHQDTLDALHILLNYDWDSAPLLSLVLIGLPELQDRLALRRNRSLYSRLPRRLRIEPLTPEDTATYLRLRLHRVGCDRDLFTTDAIAMLHEAVAGTMRDLDRLAHAALRDAARKKRRLIERDCIQAILTAPPSA